MKSFKKRLKPILRRLGKMAVRLEQLRFKIKKKFGWLRPPLILPFRGFGNLKEFHFKGRVLEDKGIAKPTERDKFWKNMVAMYKRYVSNDYPNVKLKAIYRGVEQETYTTDEGYFEFNFRLKQAPPDHLKWHNVEVELCENIFPEKGRIRANAQVLVSQESTQFGIISDVDDTILISKATKLFQKIRLMLLKNARTRMPFEGVAAFYRALQKGGNSNYYNPIFYVSSSSWYLYDLLVEFCEFQGIPKGPFMLRTSRLDQFQFVTSIHKKHKLRKIETIMATYAHLKFILIGDSGQKDAEIYQQVVKDYPGRVIAIYIRDISKEKRDVVIDAIAAELMKEGIEMVRVQDTEEAAIHAASRGYINADSLAEIRGEKIKDLEAPTPMEQVTSEALS